jgi:hypothetical protein
MQSNPGGMMNHLRSLLISSALVISCVGGLAQANKPAQIQNLQNCMDGFSDCSLNQLSASEQKSLTQSKLGQNFQNCYEGFPDCDMT